MSRNDELLFRAVEGYQRFQNSAASFNPVIREYANKMLEISLWELWALTQEREN